MGCLHRQRLRAADISLAISLVERTGWHHYALRAGGQIRAVRSMYIGATAWPGSASTLPFRALWLRRSILTPGSAKPSSATALLSAPGALSPTSKLHALKWTLLPIPTSRHWASKAYFRSHYGY